jgi:hypothetical protein
MKKVEMNVAGEAGTMPTYEELMAKVKAAEAKNAELENEKSERIRIENLKTKNTSHPYCDQAIQILVKRNLTEKQQDELAPPEIVELFLKIYDLKKAKAAGKTHVYVIARDLEKCQKMIAEGKALEDITLKDLGNDESKSESMVTTEVQNDDAKEANVTNEADGADDDNEVGDTPNDEAAKPEDTESAEA